MSAPKLIPLGSADAVVCDGDSCEVPGAAVLASAPASAAGYSGSVMSATVASNAATSASESTKSE